MKIDLREATWFGRERAVGYARMMALAFIPTLVVFYLEATGPLGSDFMAFWSASKLLLAGAPVDAYSPAAESGLQLALGRDHWVPFIYPPPFLLVVSPLGLLPYGIALPVWVAATYALWLSVSRRMLPEGFWPIAVYPGALVAAWHAQNGFITASLFIGGVLALRKRPILAGALFGALIIKPHLAVLIPVALIAGRQWRAFWAAAASAVGLLLVSWLVLGGEAFSAFLSSTAISGSLLGSSHDNFYIDGDDFLLRMPTVFALVKILAGSTAAWAAQAVSSVVMAAIVWWAWARPGDYLGKGAVLATATVLATPYLFSYDLPLLVLPACWMAVDGLRTGFRPWERLVLAAFYWAPLVGRSVALPLHFNPTAPMLAVFLAFCVRRLRTTLPVPLAGETGDSLSPSAAGAGK
jgi:hypothetical protein